MKAHNWLFERRCFLTFILGDTSSRRRQGVVKASSRLMWWVGVIWSIVGIYFVKRVVESKGNASGFACTWATCWCNRTNAASSGSVGHLPKAMEHLEPSRYIRSLTHPHKQTIKVNHFLLTSKLKASIPRGGHIIGVLCAFDSFITGIWNADQAGGGRGELLFPHQPLPTILSYKSFFSFSRPVHFHHVSAGLLILAPFTLGWARWAPDFWHYPCTLSCGIDLALLLLGIHCLMMSRAVIGRGLWGLYGAGLT